MNVAVVTVAELQVGQRVQNPFDKEVISITGKRCVHKASGQPQDHYVYRDFAGPATAVLRYDVADNYEITGKLADGTEYRTILSDFVILDIVPESSP